MAQDKLGKASVVYSEDRLGKIYDVEIIRNSRESYSTNES